MKKTAGLLAGVVALAAMSLPAKADTVSFLGPNPTSGTGAFSNTDPGSVLLPAVPILLGGSGFPSLGGAFIDIYNFSLTSPMSLTIAFATNTYAGGDPQFISNFQGAVVYEGADGQIGGGDDQVVLGPELAQACNMVPQCQVFGGSAFLPEGEYHLRISGNAAVDSGYGGNLSTNVTAAEVPVPGAVWLMGTVLGGAFGAFKLRNRKKAKAAIA